MDTHVYAAILSKKFLQDASSLPLPYAQLQTLTSEARAPACFIGRDHLLSKCVVRLQAAKESIVLTFQLILALLIIMYPV
ncbi:hypothetical protein AMTR_s00092p00115580 [Amborella trichopoda]|uniref:Uncharacterized protein n=1 Tax=Amborella trichopoda TaxID=13333 RepID=W1NVF6_AMBTC|nr:hypothetical protein AMTR_s00092p00115580 [Amborella trichopoda]